MIEQINIRKEDTFLTELNEVNLKVAENLSDQPAKAVIQNYLNEINLFVNLKTSLQHEVNSYTRFRPIYELKYGEEFLESPLGKRFIDVCFYFAYIYWPKHNSPRL